MSSTESNAEVRAGIFLLIALVLFGLSVYTLGKERQLFGDQYEFQTTFLDVKGLREGAPVRLGGITVGRVSRIGFPTDAKKNNIEVSFLVEEKFLDRIRQDSTALIQTQGLLGDRFLGLESGASLERLQPGAILPSREPGDLSDVLGTAGEIVENTKTLSRTLNEFLEEFKADGMGNLSSSLESLSALLKEIKDGKGLLNRLIYSDKTADDLLTSVQETSKDLRSLISSVKDGEGLLHQLIYAPEGKDFVNSLSSLSGSLTETADTIGTIADKINSGDGLLSELINEPSPTGVQGLINRLNETAENLRVASAALKDGQGTLGALLFDSQLYDDAVEITDGAKRSFLLRQAIRASIENAE